jgi:hypothetical protein
VQQASDLFLSAGVKADAPMAITSSMVVPTIVLFIMIRI